MKRLVATLFVSVLVSSGSAIAAVVTITLNMPDLSATYNGVPNTAIGAHSLIITADTDAVDLDSSAVLGQFAATAVFHAPVLGLDHVPVINSGLLLTNTSGDQIAFRWNSQVDLQGQISLFPLVPDSFISDANDLNTLDLDYSGTSTGGQWRTNVGASGPLTLATGDYFDGGQSLNVGGGGGGTVTIIPEPAGFTLVLLSLGVSLAWRKRC